LAKKHILIISPALANANNGNWQTAARWARFLRATYRVQVIGSADTLPSAAPDAVIALHARRSATALAAAKYAWPSVPGVLVLTGTDLYGDIPADAQAQESLRIADRLVVLQDHGMKQLPEPWRAKASIIFQSARALKPAPLGARKGAAQIIMIGHLRREKDPLTFMHAAGLVSGDSIRMLHVGEALDPALGHEAQRTATQFPRYRWLGRLPHATARQLLKHSTAMALCSAMEGGANVIAEAVSCGVPVLASDIPGNRGMLGDDYAGFFPLGDAAALARLIERTVNEPGFLSLLERQCAARAPLFAPEREQAALLRLMDNVLSPHE
jgi:putative glycosyltransferase (TIGR04348 family)